jgi:hypothetical protein
MVRSSNLFLLAATVVLMPLSAFAGRYVIVNGLRLNEAQVEYLERIHCGPIPNGRYWLNPYTGLFGYAGDPRPVGYFSGNRGNPMSRGNSGSGGNLSRRGLLYTPPMVDGAGNVYGGH